MALPFVYPLDTGSIQGAFCGDKTINCSSSVFINLENLEDDLLHNKQVLLHD